MATWPTRDECRQIMGQLGLDSRVVAHVEAVAQLAVRVAERIRARGSPVDGALVEAGALLHDIGRARSHGLDHASLGAQLLRERGVAEPVCRIVERHTGGGIDAEEARRLGLPVRDYTPRTLEEKIVCQVDNLFSGTRRQTVRAEVDYLASQGLPHAAAKVRALHEELSQLAGRDLDHVS